MQKNELQSKTKRVFKKTVGRGGKRGKTSGRGTKGQSARAGNKKRPQMRDIIKKLPKNRGYRFKSFAIKPASVTLAAIEKAFDAKAIVSPQTLLEKGLVRLVGGHLPVVKILATGTLTKSLTIQNVVVSKSAKDAIEKAGGAVQ